LGALARRESAGRCDFTDSSYDVLLSALLLVH
jgi:hypothetical protein